MYFLNPFVLRFYFNPGVNLEINFKVLVQSPYCDINPELLVQIFLVLLWGFAITMKFASILKHAPVTLETFLRFYKAGTVPLKVAGGYS